MLTKKRNTFRIIGGTWRGRRLPFSDAPHLRPTPDRVRETLFNWLAPVIQGARCLDPFAGSGALGFEALSRGAKQAVMIDESPEVVLNLQQNAKRLDAQDLEIYCAQFPGDSKMLENRCFDIVFLDPPFYLDLIAPCTQWLDQQGCLAPDALVYIEVERGLAQLPLPPHWRIIKEKSAGQVCYRLCRVNAHP